MTETGRELLGEVGRLGRHQTSRVLAGALGRGLGPALFAGGLLLAADHALAMPALARVLFALAVAAVAVGPLLAAFVRRLPAMRDPEDSARATEREATGLVERLVPALQILRARGETRTGYSPDLVDAFAEDVLFRARGVRPESLPYNAFARRGLFLGAAGTLLFAGTLAVLGADATRASARRFASAFAEIGPRPPALFEVTPGDVAVARGTGVTLSARVTREDQELADDAAVLETRGEPKGQWTMIALAPSRPFAHVIERVDASFEYRFGVGRERSASFHVEALDAPTARLDEVRYVYPPYTGLAPLLVDDGVGDLAAVKGSRAELVVNVSSVPRYAAIVRDKGAAIDLLAGEDGRLRATVPIDEDDGYRVSLEDRLGVKNPDPVVSRISPLADEPPFIRLLEPGEDRDLDESLRQTLRWSALDDYGLGPVALVYEMSRAPGAAKRVELYTPKSRSPEASSTNEWNLSDLDLLPGDSVTYHLETRDNDAVSGPKTARTRAFTLRFPSLAEVYAEIEEGQTSSIDEMKQVAEEIRKVDEKVEEIGRKMLKEGASSWESRQEMQKAVETQEKMSAELQKIQEQVDSSMQSLLESEFMSFEALEKMEQLQKLLDEVTTKEMKEALEKLREAMEDDGAGRKDEELAEFQKEQDELMKQLDRVIENLKQFRLEEKMKAAVRRLEELAARQERMNEDHQELAQEGDPKEDAAKEETAKEIDAAKDDAVKEEEPGDDAKTDELAAGDKPNDAGESKPKESGADEKKAADETKDDERKDVAAKDDSAKDGEKKDGEKKDGEKKDGEKKDAAAPTPEERERLVQEEKRLATDTKSLQGEMKQLSEMVKELRDAKDHAGMEDVSKNLESKDVPKTMNEMSEKMSSKEDAQAEEKGEQALTELRESLGALSTMQQSMALRHIALSQAAINRAVRDLLSLSTDEESLAGNLEEIPRNTTSATRAFADEQRRLLEGTERVDSMLEEVAKGTPLMDSAVGRTLEQGMEKMREAASGLESGAVQLANQEGEGAVDDLNAVVIQLLRTMDSMSSCPSGNPMSSAMQQLQQLSEDQQKLNDTMRQLREEMKGSKSRRLQGHLEGLAGEQKRIQRELEKMLGEIGEGGGLLGKLDDVSKKLDDVAQRMDKGGLDDQLLKDQDWALTRLLDSQRSIRERDFGKERRSETAKELGRVDPPSDLPSEIGDPERDLREDLLKALDRRYPPKYEDLIKRYFRSLSREERPLDLP